jgi:AcrR family transcriptional regulator
MAPARGRPRSQQARRAVLEAARALVEQGGYQAATIEAIAARAGVAKTTIYRSWPNRAALVVELLMQMAHAAVPPPAGPDPLGAVRTEMRGIAGASDHLMGRLLVSLVGEAQHDPEIRAALLNGLFHPRSDGTAKMMRAAQASGLIRRDIAPQVAVDLLVGPLFYRMLVRHRPLTEAFASQVFRYLMTGLEARDSGSVTRARSGRG